MKIPTMTRRKHWVYLFLLMLIETIVAFVYFMVGPPISYFGLILIGLANIKFAGAVIVGLKNSLKG